MCPKSSMLLNSELLRVRECRLLMHLVHPQSLLSLHPWLLPLSTSEDCHVQWSQVCHIIGVSRFRWQQEDSIFWLGCNGLVCLHAHDVFASGCEHCARLCQRVRSPKSVDYLSAMAKAAKRSLKQLSIRAQFRLSIDYLPSAIAVAPRETPLSSWESAVARGFNMHGNQRKNKSLTHSSRRQLVADSDHLVRGSRSRDLERDAQVPQSDETRSLHLPH